MAEDLEAIRLRYLPADGIRVLLLGESPPPKRGFFYTCDSTLYRETSLVFQHRLGFPSECARFLEAFRANGYYLDVISQRRGDKPHERQNDPDVIAGLERISRLIGGNDPVIVIGLLRRLAPLIATAVNRSTAPATDWRCVRFPSWRSATSRSRYREELAETLEEFGLIEEPPARER